MAFQANGFASGFQRGAPPVIPPVISSPKIGSIKVTGNARLASVLMQNRSNILNIPKLLIAVRNNMETKLIAVPRVVAISSAPKDYNLQANKRIYEVIFNANSVT